MRYTRFPGIWSSSDCESLSDIGGDCFSFNQFAVRSRISWDLPELSVFFLGSKHASNTPQKSTALTDTNVNVWGAIPNLFDFIEYSRVADRLAPMLPSPVAMDKIANILPAYDAGTTNVVMPLISGPMLLQLAKNTVAKIVCRIMSGQSRDRIWNATVVPTKDTTIVLTSNTRFPYFSPSPAMQAMEPAENTVEDSSR